MTSLPGVEPRADVGLALRWERLALVAGALIGGLLLALLGTACTSTADAAAGEVRKFGWSVKFHPTSGSITDATVFYNATFNGRPVFNDFRLPFSYVDYTPTIEPFHDIVDQLGSMNFDNKTPTFRGCKASSVKRADGVRGHLVNCDYRFDVPQYKWVEAPPDEINPRCALYRYEQKMYFFEDGSFRPEIIAWGPGYDNPHNYLVALRLNLSVGANGDRDDVAWTRGADGWQQVTKERSYNGKATDPAGNAWMLTDGANPRGPRVLIKPGSDEGSTLWYFARSKPSDSMDGEAKSTTPVEFMRPAQSLARPQDLYTWYRGAVHNPGCHTIPFAVGPDLIRTAGYD